MLHVEEALKTGLVVSPRRHNQLAVQFLLPHRFRPPILALAALTRLLSSLLLLLLFLKGQILRVEKDGPWNSLALFR